MTATAELLMTYLEQQRFRAIQRREEAILEHALMILERRANRIAAGWHPVLGPPYPINYPFPRQ